jgi:hypothetical protein
MSNVRLLLTSLVVVIATLAAGSKDAHAQRRMLVLIDATGSMTLPRPGDMINPTRFHAAKALATQRVLEQDALGLDGVAVYTFQDASATLRTVGGFVPTNDALIAIDGLNPNTVPFGITPLAGSMCDAVDTLVLDGGATKILQVSSDGEENATPAAHPCFGPFSTIATEPFSAGSWQNKVYVKAVGAVIVRIDLFNPAPIISFAAQAAADPEGGGTAMQQQFASIAAAAINDRPPTLEEFFGALARATGGQLVVAHDEEPLPVFADMDGDRCVNRTDAILLARQFGRSIPAVDGKFDLNQDGVVGFADYQILLDHRTNPACGAPDPYVLRAPISCHGAQIINITGAVIESTALAVDVRGACKVTISDSLLVAGQDAIKIVGAGLVTVDNSIIVGEHGALVAVGATKLSAANTIFHGLKQTVGAFLYIDRGGNIWE